MLDKEKLNEVGLDCISLRVSRDGNVINYIFSNGTRINDDARKYIKSRSE